MGGAPPRRGNFTVLTAADLAFFRAALEGGRAWRAPDTFVVVMTLAPLGIVAIVAALLVLERTRHIIQLILSP